MLTESTRLKLTGYNIKQHLYFAQPSKAHVLSSFERELRLDRFLRHELAEGLKIQSSHQKLQIPRCVLVLGAALQRSTVRKELVGCKLVARTNDIESHTINTKLLRREVAWLMRSWFAHLFFTEEGRNDAFKYLLVALNQEGDGTNENIDEVSAVYP